MRITLFAATGLVFFATSRAIAQQSGAPPAVPATAQAPSPAKALGLIVFPAQSQTAEQQLADEQACYAWANQQTGIDPTKVTANTDSAARASGAKMDSAATGAAVGGAARGAAGGAVVGAITGDAGEGAAVGAAVGAVAGRRAKKQAVRQAEQQGAQQAQAQAAQKINTFKKAMATCLQGKGYTVS